MDNSSQTHGVVGLGYVGLPLALAMSKSGFDVIGVDIDKERVDMLANGTSYITDVSDEEVTKGLEQGFEPTTEYDDLSSIDSVSICVPTPMRKTGSPNLSYVSAAADSLEDVIPEKTTVILESTVYPGATEEMVAGPLTENGWEIGEDVFVAFSPERIDPGNEEYGPTDIPKVLGGVTQAGGDRAQAIYEQVFDQVVRVDSAKEAELVKLLENTFRAVNIGLINEMAQVAHRLDADIWNVIDAAKTKPFGYMPFYPGPGLGGHCIPVDPMFLSWQANQQGIDTEFIDLADQVNREMPEFVVSRVIDLLNAESVPVPDANVLILGTAYKPNVSDTRESPAFDIISELEDRDATIAYTDPYVPAFEVVGTSYESVELTSDRLDWADIVIILTDHDDFDIEWVVEESSLLFDTRNATADLDSESVYKL